MTMEKRKINSHVIFGVRRPSNKPNVILPLMISGFLRISANAANGMPQFATGPQKCVLCYAVRQFQVEYSASHHIEHAENDTQKRPDPNNIRLTF